MARHNQFDGSVPVKGAMVVCYFPKRPLVENTRRLGTGCTRGKHCVEQRKLEEITAIMRAEQMADNASAFEHSRSDVFPH